MEPILCYIRESYFKEHSDLKKVLDPGDTSKQSKRTHLCIKVEIDSNQYYIPPFEIILEMQCVNLVE